MNSNSDNNRRKLIKGATAALLAFGISVAYSSNARADSILATNDGIVRESLCVGGNCSDTPNFFHDTLLLQELSLRISFNDSSTGVFPGNDWRILINDLNSGGEDYFAIEDSSAGTVPFRIDAGAPADALRISSSGKVSFVGKVGIGTATPARELHIKGGDSPTLRLQQDGSSGFTPQTWDIIGNENGFFIHDRTNATTALIIRASGDVGIGTPAPQAKLHVLGGAVFDGDVSMGSSRTLKHEVKAIAVEAILDDVLGMPLYRWKYKDDDLQATHLGPMAEDFYGLLRVGRDSRHISPSDSAGLALAAIQGLNERFEERVAELLDANNHLTAKNAVLLERLEEVERAVEAQRQPVPPGSGFRSFR